MWDDYQSGFYTLGENDDDYAHSDMGWEPKDTVIRNTVVKHVSNSTFQCDGTSLRRHRSVSRAATELMEAHTVVCSLENPVGYMVSKSLINTLTPFENDTSLQQDWKKCLQCYKWDKSFEENAKSYENPGYFEFLKENKNKRSRLRILKKRKSEDVIKKMKESVATASPSPAIEDNVNEGNAINVICEEASTVIELSTWMDNVKTCCKLTELKELCIQNNLMVSGTKDELLLRLARCKNHGSPGACPTCKKSKLKFDYEDSNILSLPTRVTCCHMHGISQPCSYSIRKLSEDYRIRHHALPFRDTPSGLLASNVESAGSRACLSPKSKPKSSPKPRQTSQKDDLGDNSAYSTKISREEKEEEGEQESEIIGRNRREKRRRKQDDDFVYDDEKGLDDDKEY